MIWEIKMTKEMWILQEVFFGIIIVIPFTYLMSFLTIKALKILPGESPIAAQNRLMLINLLKMVLSLAILILASLRNTFFLIGAFIGLLLGIVYYFWQIRKNLQGKGR